MLQVGNQGSATLDRAHLLLWCMLAAPLMIGCDLRGRRHDDPSIVALRDRAVLEIDQDPQARAAHCIDLVDGVDCYRRELTDGVAVALVNPQPEPIRVAVPETGDLPAPRSISVDGLPASPASTRLDLPGHGSALLRY